MFNNQYGLTDAVLNGRKTKTRRIAKLSEIDARYLNDEGWQVGGYILQCLIDRYSQFKVGEVVAVAQSYKDAGVQSIPEEDEEFGCYDFPADQTNGWNNKMFVRADLMPHQIRFTDLHFERLQDISDEDCIKEGVEVVESFAILANGEKKDLNYYRVPIFCQSGRVLTLSGSTPREVFSLMIDRISGKGTWHSNPFVFAYDFELVK